MTYSIPTNKLRDLILVLQTLDPDIEHSLEEVAVNAFDKRKISFSETTEAEVISEITDRIDVACRAMTADDLITFINNLSDDNDKLKETIRLVREALND